MKSAAERRAPPVIAKLDAALASLAVLEAEVDELALAAAENQPGSIGRLSAHRAKIEAIGVDCIDGIVLGRHIHDIVRSSSDIYARHNQRLGIDLVV